jgi:S1-C subfamily serine protease
VAAIGYPASASDRVIAAKEEMKNNRQGDISNMIAREASLNSGNSGAPLLSMNGKPGTASHERQGLGS